VFAAFLAAVALLGPPASDPVVVAVVDSGVDPSLPRLVPGRNVFADSADTHDDGGHGTGVARVIGDSCEACRIMPVKIDAGGTSSQSAIAAGIRWAAEHGARVINLSWGLAVGAGSTHEVERAIANATARGALVTTGAMNDGTRNPRINPWASGSPDAVRVTAVDAEGKLLRASNHGVWVDLGAPGTASSNAAPRAAAAAGLVLTAHPTLAPLQVRAALRRGCRPAPTLDVGWHCVLDPDGAVKAAAANVPVFRVLVGRKGGGIVTGGAIECGLFCTDRLDRGAALTLTAKPFRGNRFVRWLGACRSTRPACALRIAGPTKTVAVFAP
jgi:subtilisin family serine protease